MQQRRPGSLRRRCDRRYRNCFHEASARRPLRPPLRAVLDGCGGDWRERQLAALAASSEMVLHRLAVDPDLYVRRLVAQNRDCSPATLAELSCDRSFCC